MNIDIIRSKDNLYFLRRILPDGNMEFWNDNIDAWGDCPLGLSLGRIAFLHNVFVTSEVVGIEEVMEALTVAKLKGDADKRPMYRAQFMNDDYEDEVPF